MNPYGHFDDAAREYVITRPDTPLPWINYLGNEAFFGIISNTAGGYCFYRDARLRRLLRYRYNNVPLDSNGRYLYVRDGGQVWNPSWKPCRAALDRYECRHGLGYTRITGERAGLEVSATWFVPIGETLEVWDVRVRNRSSAPRQCQLFSFVEWCLWDAQDDMTNFQRNFSTGQVEVEGGVVYHVTEYRERRNHYAWFACSRPVDGFDTARDRFVGVHGGLDAPRAVTAGACTGSLAAGWAPVGAHQIDLSLGPGEEQRLHFLLGYSENPPERKFSAPGVAEKGPSRAAQARLADEAAVDAAFAALRAYWDGLLARFSAETPDPHVNRMAGVWNQYQCMVTFNLSRSASLYESGIGRGMGYRDSNQDILGFVHLIPDRARQRLLDLASTQLRDGTCYHQYQPLTKKGNADIGGGFNDDPLWLLLSTSAYLRETGDTAVLGERCGYGDAPDDPATLLDHLELSLRYTLAHRGPHGLPLIGHADWNDCLNLNCFSTTPGESFQTAGDIAGSTAESVMIAGLFCAACEEMAGIYRAAGRPADAERVRRDAADMRAVILREAWDGAWFRRAYDAQGRPIGSAQCKEGRIFIESQGWAVLGGVGIEGGQARQALESVRKHLFTPHGIMLQQPAYSTYHPELGEITSYPPGYKENAGIFTHNNTWIQIAEALLGNGTRAMEYWSSICPSRKEDLIDLYRCEPYVYSQMTAGRDAPTHGEAKNAWLTGTAAYSLVAITQYILGIRPDFDGLVVDPCIPPEWPGFRASRSFRGKTYRITVRNPRGVSKGVRRLTVDGRTVAGCRVPCGLGGREVAVEVEMG